MAQVLIVSNRLPVSVKKVDGKLEFYPSLGGLATGLSSYVRDRKSIWIGWPGIANEEVTEREKQLIAKELAKHKCRPVFLSKHQIDDFYNGYSNGVLWPIFHTMAMAKGVEQARYWKAYRTVNQLFADTVLSLASDDSVIWVHDYQLLLLPEMLRAEHPNGHIGFFLHIPFPTAQTFSKVDQAYQLLIGVLGADLVGFHTTGYSKHFLQTCQKLGIGIPGEQQLILPTRSVQVTKFPIGVDYEKYARSRKLKAVKHEIKRYKRQYGKCRLIVAVDRLEPSKGLSERLKAYREFLSISPQLIGKVMMVMVAAPSRMDLPVYQELKVKLEKLSAEINQTFGTANWQPVDFINQPLPFEQVTALYQLADVAFITPLRDGMNLVAKEYVATKRKNGVLILSQTTGAAEELRDALLVDPRKPATVVAALQQSLNMSRPELRRRLRSMQKQLAGNTIHTWAGGFVNALQQPVPGTGLRASHLKGRSERLLIGEYRQTHRRLLLLDYDGTLVPFTEDFKRAEPSKTVLKLLGQLASDEANEVVLISGRQAEDLQRWFGHLPINFVAEHGAVIKKAGNKSWQTIERVETTWKKNILLILEKYTALTPKAMIEIKPHSLVWHYRASPPYYAQKYAVIIKRVLKPYLKKYGVQLYQGNKILEVKDPRVNKGEAAQRWLDKPHDFVLAIGDDYTDEELFASLSGLSANTIKVGPGRTVAKYRLKASSDVVNLLKQFVK